MKVHRFALLAVLLGCGVSTLAEAGSAPNGWYLAGSNPENYQTRSDVSVKHSGKSSASLKSVGSVASGFGTLMQTFDATRYRGKRLRMTAFVRSENVQDWAGLWLRVDGSAESQVLAFDNMQDRPIKRTNAWASYAIVLDVPNEAVDIAFGILLGGSGSLWVDDFKFEPVGPEVPVTGTPRPKPKASPQNLGFEE